MVRRHSTRSCSGLRIVEWHLRGVLIETRISPGKSSATRYAPRHGDPAGTSSWLADSDGFTQGRPGGLQAGVEVAVIANLIGGHPAHILGLPRGRGSDADARKGAFGGLDADHERPV